MIVCRTARPGWGRGCQSRPDSAILPCTNRVARPDRHFEHPFENGGRRGNRPDHRGQRGPAVHAHPGRARWGGRPRGRSGLVLPLLPPAHPADPRAARVPGARAQGARVNASDVPWIHESLATAAARTGDDSGLLLVPVDALELCVQPSSRKTRRRSFPARTTMPWRWTTMGVRCPSPGVRPRQRPPPPREEPRGDPREPQAVRAAHPHRA